jgi:hypothetical protein
MPDLQTEEFRFIRKFQRPGLDSSFPAKRRGQRKSRPDGRGPAVLAMTVSVRHGEAPSPGLPPAILRKVRRRRGIHGCRDCVPHASEGRFLRLPIPATLASIDSRDLPMSAVPFDTHAIVKTLQTKGFPVEQAEGITDALKDALTVAEIATKHDIKDLQEATQHDIKELRETMESQIRELRLEFKAEIAPLKWGMGLCAAGIISLVFKAFF